MNNNKPGLFSILNLHKPTDFLTLAQKAVINAKAIRNEVVNADIRRKSDLYKLDNISNVLCQVIDAAECCRFIHTNEEWRASASQAFSLISDYIAVLNTDQEVYGVLCEIQQEHLNKSLLTEEEHRFVSLLRSEFERDGIHLSDTDRSTLLTLVSTMNELEGQFMYNTVNYQRKLFDVPKDHIAFIPDQFISQYPFSNNGSDTKQTISTDDQLCHTIIKYCQNPRTRQEVYHQFNTSCEENLEVLESLRRTRHQLAQHLGYQCYVDRYLHDKMMKDRYAVDKFLQQMVKSVGSTFKSDMGEISRAKQMVEGDAKVEPWDIPYYINGLKAQQLQFDQMEIVPYFSLDNCLDCLADLCKRLFNIHVKQVDLTPEERWCEGTNGIYKLKFTHNEKEEEIGTIYLDLMGREDKYNHSAHFAIQCGCAANGVENIESGEEIQYQLPTVALVCNLSAYSWQGSTALLNHSEAETLFHEFGHALHSLLSRTHFQHMSGTRVAMDFVETPSQLWELFVQDKRVLQTYFKHHESGLAIPDNFVEKLNLSRRKFQSIEVMNTLLHAKLDQALFGIPNDSSSREIFASLHEMLSIPHQKSTFSFAKFGHFVGYGGGYYSYLLDQVFATDIWKTCFDQDPFDPRSGEELQNQILKYGGAKDPHEMMRNMLKRESTVGSYFSVMDF